MLDWHKAQSMMTSRTFMTNMLAGMSVLNLTVMMRLHLLLSPSTDNKVTIVEATHTREMY